MNFKKIITLVATVCLLAIVLAIPAFATVTESTGDGYALYNGIKMPSISSIVSNDGYAVIVKQGNRHYLLTLNSVLFVRDSSLVFPADTEYTTYFLDASNDWTSVGDNWYDTEHSVLLSVMTPVWTNADIVNTTDNIVYLASTAPVFLDGMNVIEWDGDTTDLDLFDYNGLEYCILADYVNATSAICVVTDGELFEVVDNFSTVNGEWTMSYNNLEVCGSRNSLGTISIYHDDGTNQSYVPIIAYRTTTEDPPGEGDTDEPQPPRGWQGLIMTDWYCKFFPQWFSALLSRRYYFLFSY